MKLVTNQRLCQLTFVTLLLYSPLQAQQVQWTEGNLDIHHIHSGSGNSTFMIFPDGTTLLFDVGDINRSTRSSNPLKASPPSKGKTVSAAGTIVKYIKQTLPNIDSLDFLLISHFHDDHYGHINSMSRLSKKGPYKLSGVTEVHELLPIKNIVDRGFPQYQYPVNIAENHFDKETFLNYLSFVKFHSQNKNIRFDSLRIGDDRQFLMQNKILIKNFSVRNVKSNGYIWTGKENEFRKFIPDTIPVRFYNENPLSIAIKVSYGSFDYFTGGDMTGLKGFGLPTWFDTETPTAAAIGEVDALSLNHHGVRDATNEFFLSNLKPKVIIQQSWSSNHPGEEVLHRIIQPCEDNLPPAIFATYIHPETIVTYGRWLSENYKSMRGHVLIRVSQEGNKYWVYTLDDAQKQLKINNSFGPFLSK